MADASVKIHPDGTVEVFGLSEMSGTSMERAQELVAFAKTLHQQEPIPTESISSVTAEAAASVASLQPRPLETAGKEQAEPRVEQEIALSSPALRAHKGPSIKQVVIQNLATSEVEWILVYAYFCSNEGLGTFTKEDVRLQYDATGRYTKARIREFSTNFKHAVKREFICESTDTEYMLTDAGKRLLTRILSGEKRKKAAKAKHKKQEYTDLHLITYDSTGKQLRDFYCSKKPKTRIEQSIVLMYWYEQEAPNEDIIDDTIYTLMKYLDKDDFYDVRSTLSNARLRNKYVKLTDKQGCYRLTPLGKHIVETM